MTIKVTYNVTDVYVTQDVSPVYINVSYSGGGSGAAVWGGITGTLSNQTDLQNALNAKFDDPTGTTSQYLRGDGTLATFPAIPSGTVQSVGLTMPSAFSVANSPVTSSGTLAVTGAGTSAQYIRGDGQLANFPDNQGGGSSFNYYLNGSVNQGTFGGTTYYEMSKTPVLGAGTNFTRTNEQGNGYIASFITDAGDPSLLNIPGGNWTIEFYFQSSSTGGSPQFYAELYKVSSSNVFTLVASGSSNPEGITNGTTVDQYFTSIPVPQTSLLVTDRLAVRIYVIPAGRTITLHTENSNLCEILTTFSTGLNALNGLTTQVQYFATGTSGTDFGISSATDTHTFNLPTASSVNRGALSSADWTTFNNKVPASRTLTINGVAYDLSADRSWTVAGGITGSGAAGQVAYWTGTSAQSGSNNLFWDNTNGRLGIGLNAPNSALEVVDSSSSQYVAVARLLAPNQNVNGRNTQFYLGASMSTRNSASWTFYYDGNASTANYQSFQFNGIATTNLTMFAGGNNVFGGTTDGGQRLQVQGTTLLNGNVTFSSATGMFWDATNSRLGIGTNAPDNPLTVNLPMAVNNAGLGFNVKKGTGYFLACNGLSGVNSFSPFFIGVPNVDAIGLGFQGNLFNTTSTNPALLFSSFNLAGSSGIQNSQITLAVDNGVTRLLQIRGNGNMLLQNGGTFTDSGERLQVTGDVKIVGSGATSGTTSLRVQNSSATNLLTVQNNGVVSIPTQATIGTIQSAVFGLSSTFRFSVSGLRQGGITLDSLFTTDEPSGNINAFAISHKFISATGSFTNTSLLINPTINQTGTSSGISRAIYVNPSITTVVDFRAIETTNGKVIFGNLPTSSAGLPTGAIWNDAGTIKIV